MLFAFADGPAVAEAAPVVVEAATLAVVPVDVEGPARATSFCLPLPLFAVVGGFAEVEAVAVAGAKTGAPVAVLADMEGPASTTSFSLPLPLLAGTAVVAGVADAVDRVAIDRGEGSGGISI